MRISFCASETDLARAAKARLEGRYGAAEIAEADVIVALGGDGLMLQTLHENIARIPHGGARPVYGMNRGSVGFLMNDYSEEGLIERLAAAVATRISPLVAHLWGVDGFYETALAVNEVSLLRETRQAAKFRIVVDGQERLAELICDGVLVATPAGSTAYNFSADGPILPLGAALHALTPISVFRPRRWRGALLPDTARLRIEVLEPVKRPVSAVADFVEIRDVREVEVAAAKDAASTLLFDPDRSLDERLMQEQFFV